ncbi:MAG: FimV family protein, partial [Anaerolineae bacterium]
FDGQLITEQGIRGQVLQGPEASERLDNRAIWLMVNAHLVRAEKRRGATWFELAHDRLIEPVRMDNAAWREDHLSALQRQAAVWGSQGRPADLLLRGEALEEAERWADAHPDELTRSERDFLAECRNARTIRQSRRNRTLAVSATIISGIVITAFFVSLGFFFRANNEAIRAREAAAEAVLAKEKAEARAIQRANALEVAREALQTQEAYLEAQLQELASATPVIEPTAATSTPRPTGTPSSQLTPAPRPTPTITRAVAPTLSPGQEATAAVEVLQQQLAYVRATQTSLPPDDESPFLYGFFDPGGEYLMRQAGVTGWILYPTLVNEPPQNLTSLTNEGFGVLVELNWGYNPNGTLPHETLYSDFADLCEKWVSQSQGVSHWIIGHEPNKRSRRPGFGTPNEQAITPRMYAEAFRQVRAAIRSVPGHENDQIITAAVAPWNVETTYGADPKGMYDANPTGNWIEYFRDMLLALEGDVDGIALTTATHRVNLTTVDTYITSEEKRWPDLFPETGGAYFHFRAYRDFMHAIPGSMRYLPVYITKADQDSDPLTGATWFKQNLGWVQDAYAEINDWNSDPNNQKIRALLLYRWRTEIEGGDRWGISRNEGVLQDFMQALQHRYRWR